MVGAEGGAEQSELRVPGKNVSCSLRWVADERAKDPGFFYNYNCHCSNYDHNCSSSPLLLLVVWDWIYGVSGPVWIGVGRVSLCMGKNIAMGQWVQDVTWANHSA